MNRTTLENIAHFDKGEPMLNGGSPRAPPSAKIYQADSLDTADDGDLTSAPVNPASCSQIASEMSRACEPSSQM
jgi:hypothetical protein